MEVKTQVRYRCFLWSPVDGGHVGLLATVGFEKASLVAYSQKAMILHDGWRGKMPTPF